MLVLRVENPEHGVTVDDPSTGQQVQTSNIALLFTNGYNYFQQVVLSEKDADVVKRAASNRVPDPNVDIYADHVPWFRWDQLR